MHRRTFAAIATAGVLLPRRAAGDSARRREVAITIDDGPASGSGDDLQSFQSISNRIREAFLAAEVPAIMFINERQLDVDGQRPERIAVLERWIASGLELGNHTYAHRRLADIPVEEFFEDIIRGEEVSRRLLAERDRRLEWFRYPYLSTAKGAKAAAVESFLRDRDYRIAPVTVDYKDYRYTSNFARQLRAGDKEAAEQTFESVLRALDHAFERSEEQSRALLGYELPQILLIHCNELNATKLPETLGKIRDRGYQFVSLATAMRDPAYRTPDLPPGSLGGPFFSGLAQALKSQRSTQAPE